MARKLPERIGGATVLTIAARTSMEVTVAKLEELGAKEGDLIVVYPYVESEAVTLSCTNSTAGVLAAQTKTAGFSHQAFYKKEWAKAAMKVEWGGASKNSDLVVEVWRIYDKTTPIDVVSTATTFAAKAEATSPSVTTATDHAMQLSVNTNNSGLLPKETPAGWTKGTWYSPSTIYRERAEAGETGTTVVKFTGSTSGAIYSFAIRGEEEASKSATVEPPAAGAVATALAPTVEATRNVTVEPPAAVATASALAPTISSGTNATVAPPVAVATATALVPSVTTTRSAVIEAPVATATATALAPAIQAGARDADSPSTRVRIRELPRLPLNHEAETPSGRFYRWAKDEPRPENVPSGFGFATSMPGGFDTENVTLPRKPGVDYSDLERLTTLRARGAGGGIASEMRLSKAPRTSGDQFSVGPEAQGWRAHLEDDPTAAEIYRDIDLSGWAGPSRARQVAQEGASSPPSGPEIATDVTAAIPAVRLTVDETWTTPTIPVAEAWYDAGAAALVAKVYYDFAGYNNTSFILDWISSVADNATTQVSADLYSAITGAGTAEPTEARRFFAWNWLFNATNAGAAGVKFSVDLRRLAVYGNHGLTLQGTEPNAGFLASDVIANAISRWAPLLNFSTGSAGTIRPTAFVIPHLSFKDRTTVQAMIDATNAYELRPYAVWEDRTFHYHQWGDRGRKWRARVAPTQLAETGPTVERLRNGVIVAWRDVDGSTRWAGPIGSGCDAEDESLEDRDPENPANQRGLKMYGQPIDIGVSVESEAIRVGALNLARFQETDTSGEAQIVGTCTDDRGIERPAWQMRAGDTIVFVDAFDTRERRIIRTSYNEDTYTNTITLDAPPQGTPDLLAQMGASISDLGL